MKCRAVEQGCWTVEDGIDRVTQNFGNSTNILCITSQKSEDLFFTAAETLRRFRLTSSAAATTKCDEEQR
jgi:hypothetical protein